MNKVKTTFLWQCSCGKEFQEVVKTREGCLPFLINGKSPVYVIQMKIEPEEFIAVEFKLPDVA